VGDHRAVIFVGVIKGEVAQRRGADEVQGVGGVLVAAVVDDGPGEGAAVQVDGRRIVARKRVDQDRTADGREGRFDRVQVDLHGAGTGLQAQVRVVYAHVRAVDGDGQFIVAVAAVGVG